MGYEYPDGQSVDFYGIEVLQFYVQQLFLYFSSFAPHIRSLFLLITLCIITMIVLFFIFMFKIKSTKRLEADVKAAHAAFDDGFYSILVSDQPPKVEDLEQACNMSYEQISEYKPAVLSVVISEICMDLAQELDNIPNADILCSLIGVKGYYERNLANKNEVMLTLQNLVNMHIKVSEGLLAIYINHYDNNVRHMARMSYIISTDNEPYRYFLDDLNERQALWRPMMLHRVFGWLKANEKQMPQFFILAENVENDDTAAFLIEEVAYWGNEHEKSSLHELFLAPKYAVRRAALKAVTILRDQTQEQYAIDSYDEQPESIRQDVLRAVHAINSDKQTDFFVEAYRKTSSKKTKEVALTCLYTYGTYGRRTFDLMRHELMLTEQNTTLMNQIDAMSIVNQMRMIG